MRADVALVERGLCNSRAQAQTLIEAGKVKWVGPGGLTQVVKKPAQVIEAFQQLAVEQDGPQYVSRGGLKLDGALKDSGLNVKGLRCVDFGQSTGGFTDCLLQNGAESVVGFDVGHGQLHASLAEHPKVLAFEGVNLKDVDAQVWLAQVAQKKPLFCPFDLAVADLSFIALQRVLPALAGFLQPGAQSLMLVKPQFELGPQHVGKNGLVKHPEKWLDELHHSIQTACEQTGFVARGFYTCRVPGGDGNQEYFVWAEKIQAPTPKP